jgi:hypothetical protein
MIAMHQSAVYTRMVRPDISGSIIESCTYRTSAFARELIHDWMCFKNLCWDALYISLLACLSFMYRYRHKIHHEKHCFIYCRGNDTVRVIFIGCKLYLVYRYCQHRTIHEILNVGFPVPCWYAGTFSDRSKFNLCGILYGFIIPEKWNAHAQLYWLICCNLKLQEPHLYLPNPRTYCFNFMGKSI